ncbi:MAG: coenzyme F420-0:L-glutamate ligase [Dermatophilus congolensis]|nr:coenzyme F420-0:L-glutamate ligase [Dermatophilus congolensis]
MTSGGVAMSLVALDGVPEVHKGDDVAALLASAMERVGVALEDGDVLVVSSKVVSKARGLRAPADQRAELVMQESDRVVAERATANGVTRIVRALAGPTLAGAGIDASNVGPEAETVLLLPRDPDHEARVLRDGLIALTGREGFGVILSDTSGRPWRAGQVDYALGAAGVPVLDDLRESTDADGRRLTITQRAVADELASAADLVKGKASGIAAVLVRGAALPAETEDGTSAEAEGAARLCRARADDWFALGSREAVLSALGIPPASTAAEDVGLPMVGAYRDDAGGATDIEERIERACRAATHPAAFAPLPSYHPRAAAQRPEPLIGVRTTVVQTGVRIDAPDEFTLGLVAARLVAVLAAEGVAATLARDGHGAPPRILGLPAPAGAVGTVLFV